ncbi:hypothetical protein GKZ28_25105 [Clostridium chromiireducens]|uniref:Chemotaxis protein CheA n=1 Tax=Clostridium chromiireducens TaxID=225345 RepID=A0A964W535_9CLOT|nr:chemotaxis protein CheA [Clostridium chromiireducens]MVX66940.1 hypothetical protein [Clostridium chromiireducens]
MNEILEGYIEDLKYNLMSLNEALMEMEKGNTRNDVINTVFRVAHTIKGNSAAMEFYNIEKVTHKMEDLLQEVRSGQRVLTDEIINILYSFHDFMEDCLTFINKDKCDKNIVITEIVKRLIKILTGNAPDIDESPENNNKHDEILSKLEEFKSDTELWNRILENFNRGFIPYWIEVAIDEKCVMKSIRTWLIFEVASAYGSIISSVPKCPSEEELGSDEEFIINNNSISFLIVTDKDVDLLINELFNTSEVTRVKKQEIVIDLIKQELEGSKKENEVTIDEKANASNSQNIKQSPTSEKQADNFIRIPVLKVDGLMDMLGELLILNSQFEQQISEAFGRNSSMMNNLSRTSKLIKEIQASSMSLRMIEIKPTLHRLHRVARDTAAELNKKISIIIEGEETEIDRSAAEKIFDPLMHLVRNAVSHGIEEEEERIKAGKKIEGTIKIKAYSKRDSVYVEVSDDGKGIDTQKILKKALALNMAEENKVYSEEEIIKFIFKPGFSTQEVVNNISGRGVGMNVVEEVISHLGGKIDVVNVLGEGCVFTVKIPMNLAVMNGTIIEAAGGRYIIPTLFIKEFFIVDKSNLVSIQNKTEALLIRNNIIPVVNVSKMFGISEKDTLNNLREVVILEMDQKLLAFPVDRIIARQEIVSKPLESEFSSISYASGAAILGDGKVSLILDVEEMFKM